MRILTTIIKYKVGERGERRTKQGGGWLEGRRKDLECTWVAAEDQGTGGRLLSTGLQGDTSPSVCSREGDGLPLSHSSRGPRKTWRVHTGVFHSFLLFKSNTLDPTWLGCPFSGFHPLPKASPSRCTVLTPGVHQVGLWVLRASLWGATTSPCNQHQGSLQHHLKTMM